MVLQRFRATIGDADSLTEDVAGILFPNADEDVKDHVGFNYGVVVRLEAASAVGCLRRARTRRKACSTSRHFAPG